MITKTSLKDLLKILGFSKDGDIWTKKINNAEFGVNFKENKLLYPKGVIVNDETTSNLDKDENFVVFECVHRLIEKGYRPEHIELEKKWPLGHDPKGGKADICVRDENKNMLLIIECKTASKYDKAWKQTKNDGGQIFSYRQQERGTKRLSLYTSDIEDGNIVYRNDIISCSDDANVLLLSNKDESILLYKNAKTAKDLFNVWDETYGKQSLEGLIFGDDTVAYNIGIKPLRKKDLKDFRYDDRIVNKFEEILRHNNVSDKENAFNRLIALFICKLYDEITKGENDEVEFQYKVGSDTYETLQDRLQRLHRDGMENFMEEKIAYIENDYAENLFANKLDGKHRKAAIEDLKNTIRILKFYSNNDFSFKDVHNEELFLQNGKILVEVVQLFEGYRIVYPGKQQILGDLFEQLLNKGFKQNEGQFFTPTPITRFIWDCLPLEKITFKKGNYNIPKVIDYACGAGHFLTEAVEAINDYFKSKENEELIRENNWVKESIFGVEKDYRLARVAKVSLYMNGAGKGNIIFGDGLEQYKEKGIENGSFDILVANPPYSVSSFKEHLKLKNNELEILNSITNDGGEIETAFIERIAQLLKPKGIAAVILPSPILSNGSKSYINARKILLKNFCIHAITQLGGKTFGATTTNTVVLFLEKYNEPPKQSELIKDTVNTIISGKDTKGWKDQEILERYLENIGVTLDDYIDFIKEKKEIKKRNDNEYFSEYVKDFSSKKESSKANAKDNFYQNYKAIEAEKLYYFSLVYNQNTLIISSPSDNTEQKVFLGYDRSNRKGSEGIQILNPGGEMYDDLDRYSEETLASAVRKAFNDEKVELENVDKYYKYLTLSNMIDFSRPTFDASIRTSAIKKVQIPSKYPQVKLGDYAKISSGDSAPQSDDLFIGGKYNFFRVSDVAKHHLTKNLTESGSLLNDKGIKGLKKFSKGTILIPKSGASTYLDHRAIMGVDGYVVSHLATINVTSKDILTDYLYELLINIKAKDLKPDSGYPSLNETDFEIMKIPLPPMKIQKKIIKECSEIDKEYEKNEKIVFENMEKINDIMKNIKGESKKLGDVVDIIKGVTFDKKDQSYSETNNVILTADNITLDGNFDVVKKVFVSDSVEFETSKKLVKDDVFICFSSGSRKHVGKVAFITEDTNYLAGGFMGILRVKDKNIEPKYIYEILNTPLMRDVLRTSATGSNILNLSNSIGDIKITIPTNSMQKKILSEIEIVEKKIKDSCNIIDMCLSRKRDILSKNLI